MDIRKKFTGKYLKAAQFDGPQTHVMAKVYMERVGGEGDKTEKPVLYLEGLEQGLVLNQTNSNTIGELYGYETQEWAGKAIEVYPARTEFGGRMVDCLRVREVLEDIPG